MRRTSLELLKGVCEGTRCGQCKQEVDVVRCSTSCDKRKTLALGDARQIGIQIGPAILCEKRLPILGAEDAMNEITGVRVAHGAPSLRDCSRFGNVTQR